MHCRSAGAGLGAGLGVDMSLRQPVSVPAPELNLPSDEELAKRELSWVSLELEHNTVVTV